MNHIAIDLGGIKSQLCVYTEGGRIIQEENLATGNLPDALSQIGPGRVIMETCAESFHVARKASAHGHDVRIVPASIVKSLGIIGKRGIKTDVRDARELGLASIRSDLPGIHIPEQASIAMKQQCGMRDGLIKSRTALINTVRGWLRGELLRVKTGATHTFVARMHRLAQLEDITLPSYVLRHLASIDLLTTHIKEADAELKAWAKANPLARRLMTAPGVGPVTAARFIAAVDDISRFPDAHKLESYFGLTPGERSSGTKVRRTGITKAGAPAVRKALIQSAWIIKRTRPGEPIGQWAAAIHNRRGSCVSAVAVARKLAGILYAMWRDGTDYDAARSAQQTALEPVAR